MTQDKNRLKRNWVEQAVSLALRGRWDEAVAVNDKILSLFPDDADAYNRLGKAYTELRRYAAARAAYDHTLRIDSFNTIAKKNLQRLSTLTVEPLPSAAPGPSLATQQGSGLAHLPALDEARALPQLFLETMGKTGHTVLVNPANMEILARFTAGTPLNLELQDNRLVAISQRGEHLGDIEARLAQRLINFLKAGNRYAAAITTLDIQNQTVKVIIRESYQDPSMAGRVSFPPKHGSESGFRAYTKESLLKLEEEEDERFPEENDFGVEAGPLEEPTEEAEPYEQQDPDDQ
jgi:tetratricopeptide (TPR) repeat protein